MAEAAVDFLVELAMPTWERTIDIEAPPERVWDVMADVARWPEWTESIVSIEPPATGMDPGAQALLQAKGTPKSMFTVTEWQPGESFVWETTVRGVRSIAGHVIEGAGSGRSRVTLSVEVRGFIASLLRPFIGKLIIENLEMEAEGLKRESERVVISS